MQMQDLNILMLIIFEEVIDIKDFAFGLIGALWVGMFILLII